MVSRVALKKKLSLEICAKPYSSLRATLHQYIAQELINPLFSYICSGDELLRWRAVSSFGIVVPAIADVDMETARIIMRRYLWSLNDESGGIGWGAPESLAEIMSHHKQLRSEYLHMLISYMREDGEELFQDGNFLELPMLQRGLLWGIGRLSIDFPELMKEQNVVEDVKRYLDSADTQVVALALRCLNLLGIDIPEEQRAQYHQIECNFNLYENGELKEVALQDFL